MHQVSYVELHTPNVDQARGFYGELFGWKFKSESGTPRYDAIEGDQKGGIMEEAAGSGFWLQYLDVVDIERTAKRAEQLGAKVVRGLTEVPGQGRFVVLADPTGAAFALWQKA